MSELFLTILNMSLTASYVILFVIFVRLLLKKAPKVISYALWGVVAFRLTIPFSFESVFSLLPRNTNIVPIPHDIIYQQSPQINSGIEVVDSFVSKSLPAPTIGASVNPLQIYIEVGSYIWTLGIMVLLIYSLVSVLLLKRQLKSAQLIEQNIFEAKNLKTPFVLGLIRPKIYLPVGLNVVERSYILLHEQTHIHRKDHIIKLLAFLTLSIHWFNPLVWIAFMLMSTDMELSCDERVLKEMDVDTKKPYATSLLTLAIGRHILNGSPLAFGEGNARGRIKNVLNYKKPRFWIVAVSMIIVVIICLGLITNPVNKGVIMVNDILYRQSGERINELPPDAYESGMLESILHNRNKIPERNFQGAMLDERYAENLLYQSEGQNEIVYLEDLSGYYIVFVSAKDNSNSTSESSTNSMKFGSAEELWNARTKYIGDNSAVGNIISLLPVPGDIKYDHFELHTSEQPYDIEIVYSASSEVLAQYDTEEMIKSNPFHKNALILLALIDNANGVRAVLTDEKREVGFINGREWADYTVGEDVRNYAKSPEKLQELIDSTRLGIYSYNAVRFDTGEYGYLHTSDWTLGTLSYIRGDMMYTLFDFDTSAEEWEFISLADVTAFHFSRRLGSTVSL